MANILQYPNVHQRGNVTFRSTAIDVDGVVHISYFWDGDTYPGRESFKPNVEAFQNALDHITQRPETWNQGRWLSLLRGEVESPAPECGTAGCLAGTVALLNGARPHTYRDADGSTVVDWDAVMTVDSAYGDEGVPVSTFAEEILGLNGVRYTANLFGAINTLHQLWSISQVLCGGALRIPDYDVIQAAQEVSHHLYGDQEDYED